MLPAPIGGHEHPGQRVGHGRKYLGRHVGRRLMASGVEVADVHAPRTPSPKSSDTDSPSARAKRRRHAGQTRTCPRSIALMVEVGSPHLAPSALWDQLRCNRAARTRDSVVVSESITVYSDAMIRNGSRGARKVVRRHSTRKSRRIASPDSEPTALRALVAVANAEIQTASDAEIARLAAGVHVLAPDAATWTATVPAERVGAFVNYVSTAPDDMRAELAALQVDVRALLDAAAAGAARAVPAVGDLSVGYSISHPIPAHAFVQVHGRLRDVVMLRALNLLVTPLVRARLRGCPVCARVFVRRGRQAYCSARCKARADARARQRRGLTLEQRVKRAERAHRYYARRVQRELGTRVKVERRARLEKPSRKTPRRRSRR